MMRTSLFLSILIASAAWGADDVPAGEPMASAATVASTQRRAATEKPAQGKTDAGDKTLSGMSILGNQEAPKSLVIVPWKSSQIGDTLGLAEGLDDSRKPVDKEVFMRELAYYEIRSQ
jgi:hypothetical protein